NESANKRVTWLRAAFVAAYGIDAPGLVDTQLTASWTQAQELWQERAPMRRAASPEDIAQAVSLLIESNYLTGEVLLSDGGLNLT
ncbi:SDR family oxidoreductase, partial [Paenibacillus polymyxa]|nr:SDR family oxidoreductase [Paenibacillus polymyxa]